MGLFADGFKELKKAGEPLYRTPKSMQQTIEIMKVVENGIFEVARNRFSKCYRLGGNAIREHRMVGKGLVTERL